MSLSIDQIVNSQVHVGTLKSEAHPKTRQYRLDVIDGMVVFNPEIIVAQLEQAREKVQKAKKSGQSVLIVCEKKMYAQELEKLATAAGVSFLNYKVPAGFLTNFDTFQSRVASMNKMIEHVQSEEFDSLTKKEQLTYKRNLAKVERVYKGIKTLKSKPDLVLVVDAKMMSSFVDEIANIAVPNILITSSDFFRRWDEKSLVMANV